MALIFFVPGEPIPQGSLRRVGKRLTADNPRLKEWRRTVGLLALRARRHSTLFAGPLTLHVRFTLPAPQSIPRERAGLPCVPPDLDKLTRAIGDALKGVLYQDDGQLCRISATKQYARQRLTVGALIVITSLT